MRTSFRTSRLFPLLLVVLAACAPVHHGAAAHRGDGGDAVVAASPGDLSVVSGDATTTTDGTAATGASVGAAGPESAGVDATGRGGASSTGTPPTTSSPAPTTTSSSTTTPPGSAYAAPGAGTYRYDTSGSAQGKVLIFTQSLTFPSVSTLEVDPPSGSTVHSVRSLMNGSNGMVVDQTLAYGTGGISVVNQRLTMSMSGNTKVRTVTPSGPALWLAAGAAPGAHRDISLTGDNLAGTEAVDVLRGETVSVGGQPVDALLVQSTLRLTGSTSGTITLQQWLVRGGGLPVKEHTTGTVTTGSTTVTLHYDAVLQRLTP